MSLSNYAENKVLDHIFIGQESPWDLSGSDLYIGLATASASDGDGITEVSNANSYARVKIVDQNTDANNVFAAASNGSCSTDTQITFATASGGNWGTITHIGIWDSGTYGAGNLIAWGALSVNKTITDGDTFIISSGSLTVTLD